LRSFAVKFVEMQRVGDLTRLISRDVTTLLRVVQRDVPEDTPA
jgi:hypothetical protein